MIRKSQQNEEMRTVSKVTPFFLNLSICLYTKNLEKFIQRYEKKLNYQTIIGELTQFDLK